MLSSFLIKNFRLFRQLEVKHLRRVNLFVGKNNAGKSALLEAVELYSSNVSTNVLVDLVTERQEIWREQAPVFDKRTLDHPSRHLFPNHRLPDVGEEGITLGPIQPESEQVRIRVGAYRVVHDAQGGVRTQLIPSPEVSQDLGDLELALVGEQNGRTWRVLRFDRDMQTEAKSASMSLVTPGKDLRIATQAVPTRNMTDEEVASLWDTVALTGIDDEVISGLRLLEPRISGIAVVDASVDHRSVRIPLVKLQNLSERLPLRSLGDGAVRLFQIMVALVNARDGLLLVDEFENGLHWSVQDRLWEMVFRLAESFNVQVFASTHSRDCVASFGRTWSKRKLDGTFFRLNRSGEKQVTLTEYAPDTLSDALETAVEVR